MLGACGSIERLTGTGAASPRTSAPSSSSAGVPSGDVQKVQLILQEQGTYTGSVDGLLGPATREAVRSYQQAHNLPSSGELDRATLASMNVGAGPATETARTQMSDGSRLTEEDARRLIESQGFTKVVGLYRDDNAVWRGVATRNGRAGEVALDARGNVVTN